MRHALVSRFSPFQIFLFSAPPFASFCVFRGPKCIGTAPTNLTTDFTDPIWIKSKRTMPQIHPDPILPPSVVKNALVDPIPFLNFLLSPVSSFPPPLRVTSRPSRLKIPSSIFYFPNFHLFPIFLSVFLSVTAPVAQLDRASGFEPEGREFESLRAHH